MAMGRLGGVWFKTMGGIWGIWLVTHGFKGIWLEDMGRFGG